MADIFILASRGGDGKGAYRCRLLPILPVRSDVSVWPTSVGPDSLRRARVSYSTTVTRGQRSRYLFCSSRLRYVSMLTRVGLRRTTIEKRSSSP